jgi:uncharacterized protein DUF4395
MGTTDEMLQTGTEPGRPRPLSSPSPLFGFPHPVNETSARVVAGGVVGMVAATVALDQPWILFPLTYGFAARVLTGPKFSPLGQIATRVVTPRLPVHHRFSPGPPKRLAQGIGLALSGSALLLHYGLGRKRLAYGVLAALGTAATLESVAGVCLACKTFPTLMRLGLVPEDTCTKCEGPISENGEATGRADDVDARSAFVGADPARPRVAAVASLT